tara:strand:+ start:2131 stop:2472 length:342 start_codon:yes stop_codon:yes gene_type:complete
MDLTNITKNQLMNIENQLINIETQFLNISKQFVIDEIKPNMMYLALFLLLISCFMPCCLPTVLCKIIKTPPYIINKCLGCLVCSLCKKKNKKFNKLEIVEIKDNDKEEKLITV